MGFVLAGLLLLSIASAFELAARVGEPAGPLEAADVRLRIQDPDGSTLYDRPIHLEPPDVTVLDALLLASGRDGFAVELQEFSFGTMVVGIWGHRSQGMCGWVYEIDDEPVLVGAAEKTLVDEDVVTWFWACDG